MESRRIETANGIKEITSISISVPPDAYGNRGIEYDDPEIPNTIETALFNNDNIVYIDEIGYEDVLRFKSFVELMREINRIIVL